MNSGSGIQELMAAETRASQIVAEARIGQFPRGLNCYLNFLFYIFSYVFQAALVETKYVAQYIISHVLFCNTLPPFNINLYSSWRSHEASPS